MTHEIIDITKSKESYTSAAAEILLSSPVMFCFGMLVGCFVSSMIFVDMLREFDSIFTNICSVLK